MKPGGGMLGETGNRHICVKGHEVTLMFPGVHKAGCWQDLSMISTQASQYLNANFNLWATDKATAFPN